MRLLLICLSFCFINIAFAQKASMEEPKEIELVINKNDRFKVTGYGGMQTDFMMIDHNLGVMINTGGGVLFDGKYFAGIFNANLASGVKREVAGYPDLSLGLSYSGLWFNYQLKPHKMIHFTASTKIAWGNVAWKQSSKIFDNEIFINDIFVVNPEIGAELNLAEFIRVSLTGGYRIITNLDITGLDKRALNNAFIGLGFKFGKF